MDNTTAAPRIAIEVIVPPLFFNINCHNEPLIFPLQPNVQEIDITTEESILVAGSNEPNPRWSPRYQDDDDAEEQYGVL